LTRQGQGRGTSTCGGEENRREENDATWPRASLPVTGVPTAALQSVWDIVEPRVQTFGEKRGLEKRPLAEVCQGTAFAMNFGRGFGTGCRECGHRMRSGAGESLRQKSMERYRLGLGNEFGRRFGAGCQSALFEGGEIAIGAERMSWEEGRIQWAIGQCVRTHGITTWRRRDG
jgi:hypothetical protein